MKHHNMIFVFGSNKSGMHIAGASKAALRRGAQWGISEGLTGTCYAIPTKESCNSFMDLKEVKIFIETFIKFANNNPGAHFMITQIGCGLSGFTKEEIAPMFKSVTYKKSNCFFDEQWKSLLPDTAKFWGTF